MEYGPSFSWGFRRPLLPVPGYPLPGVAASTRSNCKRKAPERAVALATVSACAPVRSRSRPASPPKRKATLSDYKLYQAPDPVVVPPVRPRRSRRRHVHHPDWRLPARTAPKFKAPPRRAADSSGPRARAAPAGLSLGDDTELLRVQRLLRETDKAYAARVGRLTVRMFDLLADRDSMSWINGAAELPRHVFPWIYHRRSIAARNHALAFSLALRDLPAAYILVNTNRVKAAATNCFVIDTGATGIVVSSAAMIQSASHIAAVARNSFVRSNGHRDPVESTCTLNPSFVTAAGAVQAFTLPGALVVPTSNWNILPPRLLPGFRAATIHKDGTMSIYIDGMRSSLTTTSLHGLQVLQLASLDAAVLATTVSLDPAAAPSLTVSPPAPPLLLQLHETLAHASISSIHSMVRRGTIHVADPATRTGLLAAKDLQCRHCAMSSHPSAPVPADEQVHSESTPSAGLWSVDAAGPMVSSAGGMLYWAIWINHTTDVWFLGLARDKTMLYQYLPTNFEHMRSVTRDDFLCLRTDNGTEWKALDAFCVTQGIRREHTAPNSSFQNGKAERAIRTLRAMAGASLSRSGLPPSFWAEAVAHALHVRNRIPNSRGDPSPQQRATGAAPTLALLQPFGCLVLARVPKPAKRNLANRSRPSVYLGPAEGTRDAHRIVHLDTNAVAISRDCVFFPHDFPLNKSSVPHLTVVSEGGAAPHEHVVDPPGSHLPPSVLPSGIVPFAGARDLDADAALGLRRSGRVVSKPFPHYDPEGIRAQEEHTRLAARVAGLAHVAGAAGLVNLTDAAQPGSSELVLDVPEPLSFSAALRGPHADEWKAAVMSELSSHRRNGTWTPVEGSKLPNNRAPLPAKWVFKVKYDEDGNISRFKARLVAKGFRQRAEVDYHDTFAPTLRIPTFRMLCALSAYNRWVIHQMDIKSFIYFF